MMISYVLMYMFCIWDFNKHIYTYVTTNHYTSAGVWGVRCRWICYVTMKRKSLFDRVAL